MKVVIAGGRDMNDYAIVEDAIQLSGFVITEVVSGAAPGVDTLGERWAREHNIPCRRFPADWTTHGKAAGPIRNGQMAVYADACIAVWDGESRGTANMIATAKKHDRKLYVHRYKDVDHTRTAQLLQPKGL